MVVLIFKYLILVFEFCSRLFWEDWVFDDFKIFGDIDFLEYFFRFIFFILFIDLSNKIGVLVLFLMLFKGFLFIILFTKLILVIFFLLGF